MHPIDKLDPRISNAMLNYLEHNSEKLDKLKNQLSENGMMPETAVELLTLYLLLQVTQEISFRLSLTLSSQEARVNARQRGETPRPLINYLAHRLSKRSRKTTASMEELASSWRSCLDFPYVRTLVSESGVEIS